MPGNPYLEICEGPIPGLRLPRYIWDVLKRENIRTLEQLRAVADHIERFERMGPWSAEIIRAELARVMRPGKQPDHEGDGPGRPAGFSWAR